jgi:hypothetical protein
MPRLPYAPTGAHFDHEHPLQPCRRSADSGSRREVCDRCCRLLCESAGDRITPCIPLPGKRCLALSAVGARSGPSCAEAEASSPMRRGAFRRFDARRAPVIRAHSSSARAARRLHVGEDGSLRARRHDRGGQARDVDVSSPAAPAPLLDRQHRDDVVRSHEPSVSERHHSDVGSSHELLFAHVHIVANKCSIAACDQQQ